MTQARYILVMLGSSNDLNASNMCVEHHHDWMRGADRRGPDQLARNVRVRVQPILLCGKRHKGADVTVGAAVSMYGYSQRRKGNRTNIQKDMRNLAKFVDLIGAYTPISSVSMAMMRTVLARQIGESTQIRESNFVQLSDQTKETFAPTNPSGRTLNARTRLFRRACMMARDELGAPVQSINWKALMIKEAGPRTRTISIAEESRIRALPAFEDRFGPIFSFAILSGVPLRPLVSLTWSQVDLPNGCITGIRYRGREYSIWIDSEIEGILLNEWGNDPIHVFTYLVGRSRNAQKTSRRAKHGRRRPITLAAFRSWFTRVREKVQLDIRMSDLRRTAAKRFFGTTGNQNATRQFLGLRPFEPWKKWNRNIAASEMVELQEATQARVKNQRALLEAGQSGSKGGSIDAA